MFSVAGDARSRFAVLVDALAGRGATVVVLDGQLSAVPVGSYVLAARSRIEGRMV